MPKAQWTRTLCAFVKVTGCNKLGTSKLFWPVYKLWWTVKAVIQLSAVTNLLYTLSIEISTTSYNVDNFCNGSHCHIKSEQQELLTVCVHRQGQAKIQLKMNSSLPITQCSAARNAVCASNPSCQVSNSFKLQKRIYPTVSCFYVIAFENINALFSNAIT